MVRVTRYYPENCVTSDVRDRFRGREGPDQLTTGQETKWSTPSSMVTAGAGKSSRSSVILLNL